MTDSPTIPSLLMANERFYRTFEKLDYSALAALWEQSDRVFCVHPGWPPLSGIRPVMESWKTIIENTAEIRFSLSGARARIAGRVGLVTVFESIQNAAGDERQQTGAVSTNLFAFDEEKQQWLLFHHHASHSLIPPDEEEGPLLV